MVRYPESERISAGNVENIMIRTPRGEEVPLLEVANVSYGRGYASISRTDRKRTISVTSDVDDAKANAREIKASIEKDFMPELINRYPGLTYDVEGEQKEMQDTLDEMFRKFGLALFVIFVLMAVPFRS